MIIVTADDLGKSRQATDNILECCAQGRVTSASAMVFMEDSERAARLALAAGTEVGLHVNLTMPFEAVNVNQDLRAGHARLMAFYNSSRLAPAIYSPALKSPIEFLFRAQQEEFIRIYGRPPDFYNGHHHMHLSANMLISKVLPAGARVRRTFTVKWGGSNPLNVLYRRILDRAVVRRYITTDCFYSIQPLSDQWRLRGIFALAPAFDVELEVHPEDDEERGFLLGKAFGSLMASAEVGCFGGLG